MHNVHCLASAAFSNAFLNAPNFSEMENCFQNQGEVGKFVKFKTKKLIVLIGIKTYFLKELKIRQNHLEVKYTRMLYNKSA